MTTTYREDTVQATEAMEFILRARFKAEGCPQIPFEYGGITHDLRDRETRMLLVAAIQKEYYGSHGEFNQRIVDEWYAAGAKGERPAAVPADVKLMDRLTDIVLHEELVDEDPYKCEHNEYPIFSDTMMARRREGRRGTDDTNMGGETGLNVEGDGATAEMHSKTGVHLATDGKDYRRPIRRTRSMSELLHVDSVAKIRNRKRAIQYLRDIAPGKVVTYNLYETGGELTEPFVNCRGLGQRWAAEMGAMNETEIAHEESEETADLLSAA